MSRLSPPSLSVNLPIMEKVPSSELTPTRLGFPNEFPYEFESPTFSPGFTSPGDSTETEEESSDDEQDFLAGLTRRLAPSTHRLPPSFNTKKEEKRMFAATSPQSTLSGLGSFSNSGSRSPIFPYPPPQTTSFHRDNAWDVISAAAGEIARLKHGSYEPHLPRQNHDSLLRLQNAAFQSGLSLQQKRLLNEMFLISQARLKLSEGNRYPKRVMNEQVLFKNPRFVRHSNTFPTPSWLPVGASKKPPSAGTGVFLPRQYPTTKVTHQNLNFDEFINVGTRSSQFDNECMLARSTQLTRQGNMRAVNGGCLNQETRLPQDWIY